MASEEQESSLHIKHHAIGSFLKNTVKRLKEKIKSLNVSYVEPRRN